MATPGETVIITRAAGSSLRNLALAARYHEQLGRKKGLPAAPDLASLKRPVGTRGVLKQ